MKIIQQGDLKRLDKTLRFTCNACGCVWDANANEYRHEWDGKDDMTVCYCPTCGKATYDGKRIATE